MNRRGRIKGEMTYEDVARRFGVSVFTVIGWRRRGLLAGKIIHVEGEKPRVRFSGAEVAAFEPPKAGRPRNESTEVAPARKKR
jgi:hypothetical protein